MSANTTPGDTYSIALLGDTSFGENYQEEIAAAGGVNVLKQYGYDYCLERFRSFLLNCDMVIANLETPLTDAGVTPHEGKKQYIHWSDTEKAPRCLVDHNIRVVSLANNHTLDYGPAGLKHTLEALDSQGIACFGGGLSTAEADRPYVREIAVGGRRFQVAVFGAFETRRRYLRDFAFYATQDTPGVSRLIDADYPQRIARFKHDFPDAFVLIFPHWGYNYQWRNPKQVRMAHALIDAGADLIVGHGAHMLGEIESYAGRWIVYSLGNFVFNSEGRYTEDAPAFSYAGRLMFSRQGDGLDITLRLYPIMSDNAVTNYQPQFVDKGDLDRVVELVLSKSPDGEAVRSCIGVSADETGNYLELPLAGNLPY